MTKTIKLKKMEMVVCPSLGPAGEQQRGVGAGIGRCCHQSRKLQTKDDMNGEYRQEGLGVRQHRP